MKFTCSRDDLLKEISVAQDLGNARILTHPNAQSLTHPEPAN